MRISVTEPWSVILSQSFFNIKYKKFKSNDQKVSPKEMV